MGESEAPGEGGVVFIENAQEGGGEGGTEGPGRCLRRIGEFGGGGGAKYFFFGAETSTKIRSAPNGQGTSTLEIRQRLRLPCCDALRSGLPNVELMQIWTLADVDEDFSGGPKKNPKAKESHEQQQRIF